MQENTKLGVQQVAQDLYNRHGHLTASALVEAARDKHSPAHDGFTWDNSSAAEQYRLIQARTWIRVVKVTVEGDDAPQTLCHVPKISVEDSEGGKEGQYLPLSVLVRHISSFEAALREAQTKFSAAKRAVDDLLTAAQAEGRETDVALIAEMARATSVWEDALAKFH